MSRITRFTLLFESPTARCRLTKDDEGRLVEEVVEVAEEVAEVA